jgi:2-oxoglutarate ferredoxin oxidoreductase subunit delta
MAKIIIDRQKCKGCLLCVHFCPQRLIEVEAGINDKGIRPAKFSGSNSRASGVEKDNRECLGCSFCAIICPDCCIEVYK